jgi:ATP/maltotriose-dependent transcriptional regulator MalT
MGNEMKKHKKILETLFQLDGKYHQALELSNDPTRKSAYDAIHHALVAAIEASRTCPNCGSTNSLQLQQQANEIANQHVYNLKLGSNTR